MLIDERMQVMKEELTLSEHQSLRVVSSAPEALILESCWRPCGTSPRTHWHPSQHEHFEVLQGLLTVMIDGQPPLVLASGQTVDIPPRTAHRMWNASPDVARARWSITPRQRSEKMFRRLARKPTLLGKLVLLWSHRREIRLGTPNKRSSV
jgi:mannose-6-phosphate isomerase-like protein (cupin superfamily)